MYISNMQNSFFSPEGVFITFINNGNIRDIY